MSLSRGSVVAAVAIVAVVTLVSGPLVGAVDLTAERYDMTGLGQGNATVSVVETPETAQLDSGVGASEFYLKVPESTVRFERLSGKPIVSYRIAIDELGYSRGTTHFFTADDAGLVSLSMTEDSFLPGEITEAEYEGELSIVLRTTDAETAVYEEPITVEVNR